MTDWLTNLHQPPNSPAPTEVYDLDEFLRQQDEQGIDATWWVAVRCPCGTVKESAPSIVCPICGGRGWLFPKSQSVKLLAVGLHRDSKGVLDVSQSWYTGTAMFTARAECAPAYEDRIVLDDCRTTMTKLLTRKSNPATHGHVETLNYPVFAQDYLTAAGGTAYIGVIYVVPQASDGYPLRDIHGAVKPLVEGTDFDVTAGGHLDFTKGDALGTAPLYGKFYTISYKTRPVFRVMTQPHAVRQTSTAWLDASNPPQRLPVQFAAKLEWWIEGM